MVKVPPHMMLITPTATPGNGEFKSISGANGGSLSLPAGTSWAWFGFYRDSVSGTVSGIDGGVAEGVVEIFPAAGGNAQPFAMAWNINGAYSAPALYQPDYAALWFDYDEGTGILANNKAPGGQNAVLGATVSFDSSGNVVFAGSPTGNGSASTGLVLVNGTDQYFDHTQPSTYETYFYLGDTWDNLQIAQTLCMIRGSTYAMTVFLSDQASYEGVNVGYHTMFDGIVYNKTHYSTGAGEYPTAQAWHHLVVTFNGDAFAAGCTKVYLDGVLLSAQDPTGGFATQDVSRSYFGQGYAPDLSVFKGKKAFDRLWIGWEASQSDVDYLFGQV